jgi:predicted Zn-dependent protease
MSDRLSWGKILLAAFIVVLLGGAALGYFAFFYNVTERALLAGERSHRAGDELFPDDPARAALRYDEAVLQASKVLDDVARQMGEKVKSPQQAQRLGLLEARALWLKARALRDRAFARAAAEGDPIRETTDGTLGGTFRSMLAIKDGSDRAEALRCLRMAALRLPRQEEVQLEAIRVESMLNPVNWRIMEQICKNSLEINENDGRALYLLAQMHYDQAPIDARGSQGAPPPLEKRSPKRMKESRDLLEKAQKDPNAKYWRVTEMMARINRWMRDYGAQKPDERARENDRLKKLLAEGMKKAEDDKALTGLISLDVRAILALHEMALEEQARLALKEDEAAKKVNEVLGRILTLAERFGGKGADRPTLEECAKGAVAALTAARPSQRTLGEAWDAQVARVMALAERAHQAGVNRPDLYASLVRFLDRESYLYARKGDQPRKKKSAEAAEKWLADGLERGKKIGMSEQQMGDLHLLAADRSAHRGASLEKLKPHLDVLTGSKSREAQALGKYLEGVALEREGRLTAAARKFEESEELTAPSTRTDAALASLYLSLGKPGQALTRLGRLLESYKRLDDLTEQERAWAMEFIRSREDLQLQYVTASLESALQAIATERMRNPGKPVSVEVFERTLKQAEKMAGEIPPGSINARAARIAILRFHIALGNKEQAEKELAAFEKAFPGDSGLLNTRVSMAMMRGPGKFGPKEAEAKQAEVDALIQRHLKAYPADVPAKLYWAAWLSRTGRSDKAAAFLRDKANFPDNTSEDYKRVLALALMTSGDRAGAAEVLRQLPSSPLIDTALIRLVSAGERDKRVAEALARYERDGLVRSMAGAVAMEKGKPAEAAEYFYKALEFAQARQVAEQGLLQSLVSFAEKDPRAARERISKMIAETPEQKSLYLAYAYAAMLLDDLGMPFQSWDTAKNMATALRAWENLLKSPPVGLLTRAEMWRLAGRPDLALQEARRALSMKDQPVTPQALSLAADLAIAAGDAESLKDAEGWITALDKALPGNPAVAMLQARHMIRARKRGEALKHLEAQVAKHPDRQDFRQLLAELALEEKNQALAEAVVKAWKEKMPDSPIARATEIRLLAQAGKQAEARKVAEDTHKMLMKLWDEDAAKRKRPDGKTEEEWKKEEAARRAARSQSLRVELARSLMRGKANEAAAAALEEVLLEAPEHVAALTFAGEAALNREDWKASRAYYERLLKVSPRNGVAANNLAWILAEKLGDPARACEVLEPLLTGQHSGKPLAGDRLPPEVLDTAALVYRKLAQPAGLERVRLLLTEGRRRFTEDPRLALHLGHVLAAQEDFRGAREQYLTAIRLASQDTHGLEASQRAAITKECEASLAKLPR